MSLQANKEFVAWIRGLEEFLVLRLSCCLLSFACQPSFHFSVSHKLLLSVVQFGVGRKVLGGSSAKVPNKKLISSPRASWRRLWE